MAKITKSPFFYTEHWSGFLNNNFKKKPLLHRFLNMYIAKKAHGISTVSNILKEALITNKLSNKNFQITPNVVEFVKSEIAKKKSETVILLSVADLRDSIKNISSVISVVADLIAKGYTAIEYHIIGDGDDKERLMHQAKDLQLLNSKIKFLGRQDNTFVLNYISNATVCIINSNFETFSVFAVESLAQGVPVIATKCGGPQEIITPECGILIEPRNNEELKKSILLFIENKTSFDKNYMSNYVINKYNSTAIAQTFEHLYKTANV